MGIGSILTSFYDPLGACTKWRATSFPGQTASRKPRRPLGHSKRQTRVHQTTRLTPDGKPGAYALQEGDRMQPAPTASSSIGELLKNRTTTRWIRGFMFGGDRPPPVAPNSCDPRWLSHITFVTPAPNGLTCDRGNASPLGQPPRFPRVSMDPSTLSLSGCGVIIQILRGQ